jgi:hypothetical protein
MVDFISTRVALATTTELVLDQTMLTTEENWDATWVMLDYFVRETALELYGYLQHIVCHLSHDLCPAHRPPLYDFGPRPHPALPHPQPHRQLPRHPAPHLPRQTIYIAIIVILNIIFLATHIVMAVICVVGCWYHVYIG